MIVQTVEESVGIVARQRETQGIGRRTTIALHHPHSVLFVVLSSHSRYLAQRECTVGVLYDFVAYECSRPVWFALSTDVDITVEDSSTRAERTPSPDITVGTVAGSLARIESSAVGTTLIAPCLWLLHLHGSVFAEDAPRIAS